MAQRRVCVEFVLAVVFFGFLLVGIKTPMDIGVPIGLFCICMGIACYMTEGDDI